jgi:hypothetical protein
MVLGRVALHWRSFNRATLCNIESYDVWANNKDSGRFVRGNRETSTNKLPTDRSISCAAPMHSAKLEFIPERCEQSPGYVVIPRLA